MWIKIDQLKLDACTAPVPPEKALPGALRKYLGCDVRDFVIAGKSVDARRGRPQILYRIYAETAASCPGFQETLPPADPDESARWQALGTKIRNPIVVGTGPCGIFAALGLALAGCRPVILDRGREVDQRSADYRQFLKSRELDPESNLLIGEGGAGTFSDGKLYTNNRDKRIAFILDTFVRHGAPPEIRYLKRPHIGSDNLTGIARSLRKYLQSLGAEFRFGVQVTGLQIVNGRCTGVRTASGETLEAPCTVLAAGLGGRELTLELCKEIPFVLKPFFPIPTSVCQDKLLVMTMWYTNVLFVSLISLGLSALLCVSSSPLGSLQLLWLPRTLSSQLLCVSPAEQVAY